MTKYARIYEGAVAELFETGGDITKMFHPDFLWVGAQEDTREGDLYDGSGFSRPVVAEPEPYIPQSVTPAQGLMALYVLKGIVEDDILIAINTIEDPTLRYQALISYKKATIWERVSASWQAIADLMALSEADQDELLALAATYTNL